jgi:hypothetical protein
MKYFATTPRGKWSPQATMLTASVFANTCAPRGPTPPRAACAGRQRSSSRLAHVARLLEISLSM